VNKKPYVAPADVVPVVADMGVLVTAIALAGILDYYSIGTRVIKAPKKMIEMQIVRSLESLGSIIEILGVPGLLKIIDPELVVNSVISMKLLEEQKDIDICLEILRRNINESLIKESEKVELKPITLVATQALVQELRTLLGEKASEGAIKRSRLRLFKEFR
ncbi:5,10-methenyltetrahydromethanopterin hydrogenase family protein, partial [Methanocaldococcus sp.]|uniref:5,10-methenyltetrahydromethanopterin hydrogenase family protein n=1 Tax=Methanocaldococcus sp. TaxID=2152917 RepID=UPI0026286920